MWNFPLLEYQSQMCTKQCLGFIRVSICFYLFGFCLSNFLSGRNLAVSKRDSNIQEHFWIDKKKKQKLQCKRSSCLLEGRVGAAITIVYVKVLKGWKWSWSKCLIHFSYSVLSYRAVCFKGMWFYRVYDLFRCGGGITNL